MMGELLIGFSTDKKDIISRIIRIMTWSKFSHTVLISPDHKSYIESTHKVGVREQPISEFFKREGVEIGVINHPNPQAVWDLAKAEIGKPYDYVYIYGWLLHRNWQKDDKWACCELIPAMTDRTKSPIIRCSEFDKVTPQLLYMISTPYDGFQELKAASNP